jgi:RecA-family ATPase
MDRASGSGVFARDPDAMLDLIELEITDSIRQTYENKRECAVYIDYMHRFYDRDDYRELVSFDDEQSASRMRDIAAKQLPPKSVKLARQAIDQSGRELDKLSAWRIDMTLREFPKPNPLNLWFDYPIHRPDREGILTDAQSDDTRPGQNYRKNFSKKQSPEQKAESRRQDFETHYYSLKSFNADGVVSLKELSEQLGKKDRTVRGWIENDLSDRFRIVKGNVEEVKISEE